MVGDLAHGHSQHEDSSPDDYTIQFSTSPLMHSICSLVLVIASHPAVINRTFK